MNIPPWLEKLLSKAAYAKATELVLGQPGAATPEQKTANHEAVLKELIDFVEVLDDQVELIPFAGPILKALVDSEQVDAKQREVAAFVVESVYRSLKYSGQVGA